MFEQVRLCIHIGLCRTGTTFLQREIFPKLGHVNFIQRETEGRNYVLTSQFDKESVNLISDEGLTRINYSEQPQASMTEIAKRLHRLYPNAKIILTLRNKEDWIESLYKQYVNISFRTLDKEPLTFESWYETIFDKNDLLFDDYVSLLNELFEDVLVLDYDFLKSDCDSFIKKLCDFLDTTPPSYEKKFVNKVKSVEELKKERKKITSFVHFFRFFSTNRIIENIFIGLIRKLNQ